MEELKNFFSSYPNIYIYGEWLVPHALRTYASDAWNHFYIFDIQDAETGKYFPYEQLKEIVETFLPSFKYIPLIAKMENPTIEDIQNKLTDTGGFLCTSGLGEGIVIKNYDFINRYGRRTWAKMLTEDFLSRKKEYRQDLKKKGAEPDNTEYEIVHKMLTVEFIMKEKAKIEEEHNGTWSSLYIGDLIKAVFYEFIHDNLDIILKKWHLPIINFRKLQKEIVDVIREFLHI